MANTEIMYLYRSASNYKCMNRAVLEGTLSEAQIEDIYNCCQGPSGLNWFIPFQVGLDEDREVYGDLDPEEDGPWFELCEDNFHVVDGFTTDNMTVQELYDNFMEINGNWDEDEAFERLFDEE